MGIDIPIKNVCICESATDNAIPLAVPIKIDKNVPAHVGHAINNPVAAPIVLIPPPFLEIEYAVTAIETLRPTRYETIICSTKLIGIICKPTCSVM